MRWWVVYPGYDWFVQDTLDMYMSGSARYRYGGRFRARPEPGVPFHPTGVARPLNYKLKFMGKVMAALYDEYREGRIPEVFIRIARLIYIAWKVSTLAIIPAQSKRDAEKVARTIQVGLWSIYKEYPYMEVDPERDVVELKEVSVAVDDWLKRVWDEWKAQVEEENGLIQRVRRALETVVAFTPTVWPVLVGTTGAGKTTLSVMLGTLFSQVLMEEGVMGRGGHAFSYVPLALVDPETGWEIPVLRGDVIHIAPRDAFRHATNNPYLMFLDELDKAEPRNFKVALPLMANYLWGAAGKVPPEHLLILGAMNFPQPTAYDWVNYTEASRNITARCVFIPFPPANPEEIAGISEYAISAARRAGGEIGAANAERIINQELQAAVGEQQAAETGLGVGRIQPMEGQRQQSRQVDIGELARLSYEEAMVALLGMAGAGGGVLPRASLINEPGATIDCSDAAKQQFLCVTGLGIVRQVLWIRLLYQYCIDVLMDAAKPIYSEIYRQVLAELKEAKVPQGEIIQKAVEESTKRLQSHPAIDEFLFDIFVLNAGVDSPDKAKINRDRALKLAVAAVAKALETDTMGPRPTRLTRTNRVDDVL